MSLRYSIASDLKTGDFEVDLNFSPEGDGVHRGDLLCEECCAREDFGGAHAAASSARVIASYSFLEGIRGVIFPGVECTEGSDVDVLDSVRVDGERKVPSESAEPIER